MYIQDDMKSRRYTSTHLGIVKPYSFGTIRNRFDNSSYFLVFDPKGFPTLSHHPVVPLLSLVYVTMYVCM